MMGSLCVREFESWDWLEEFNCAYRLYRSVVMGLGYFYLD